MPKGISLQNVLIYRFHSKRHLDDTSSGFFQTFLDSEHSAKKAGRFCASYINPGFFFGLTPETSLFEFLFYNTKYAKPDGYGFKIEQCLERVLTQSEESPAFVTCRVSLDNILDLCNPSTISDTMEECFGGRVSPGRLRQLYICDSLLALASSPKYGDILTDVIGQYAWDRGFNGIKFLSARAIDALPSSELYEQTLRQKLLQGVPGDDGGVLDDLLRQLSREAANLVVFRGAYLAQCAKSFRVQRLYQENASWIKNDLWQQGEAAIEKATSERGGLTREELEELCCHILRITNFQVVRGKHVYP